MQLIRGRWCLPRRAGGGHGLDPTTPSGNIAAGCYLLGKYMADYKDPHKAAMAYNMGVAGAKKRLGGGGAHQPTTPPLWWRPWSGGR